MAAPAYGLLIHISLYGSFSCFKFMGFYVSLGVLSTLTYNFDSLMKILIKLDMPVSGVSTVCFHSDCSSAVFREFFFGFCSAFGLVRPCDLCHHRIVSLGLVKEQFAGTLRSNTQLNTRRK